MGRQAARLLAVLVCVLAALAVPGPAWAHGTLATSTPAKGATLKQPVDALTLAFTEQPPSFAYFTVTAPSGTRVDDRWSNGQPFRLESPVREYLVVDGVWEPQLYHTGFPVRVPVAAWPEKGQYVARYQTVASDGDEVKGEVAFTYDGDVVPAPPGWQAPADPPSPELAAAIGAPRSSTGPSTAPSAAPVAAQPEPEPEGGASTWLLPVVLVAGAAGLLLLVLRRPAGRDRAKGTRT